MPSQNDRLFGGSRLIPNQHDRLIGEAALFQINMIALLGEAALFLPGYECYSTVAPSDFDRLLSGYRLIGGSRLIPNQYDRLVGGSRLIPSGL